MLENLVIRPNHPYFLSHSIGLTPKNTTERMNELFFDPWQTGNGKAWDNWLATVDQFKSLIGTIINANADEVCPQSNISSALTKVLFSLQPNPKKNKILLSEVDFPTIGFVLQQAQKLGLQLKFLPKSAALTDPDVWKAAITDDIHLVHITHVFSNVGMRTPVKEIVKIAKNAGAYTIVDAAQSIGAIPVDTQKWNADFILGTGVKYLCGGPGSAFLWANPEVLPKTEPADTGWFSHKSPFEFNIHNFEMVDNASRFLGGSPSIAPLAFAIAGLEMISTIGVKAIEKHNQALIDLILQSIPNEALRSHNIKGERGSHIMFEPQDRKIARDKLREAGCACDERKGGFRVSVHGYTNKKDVGILTDVMADFF